MSQQSGSVKPPTTDFASRRLANFREQLLTMGKMPNSEEPIEICQMMASLSTGYRSKMMFDRYPGFIGEIVKSSNSMPESRGFVPHMLHDVAKQRAWMVVKFRIPDKEEDVWKSELMKCIQQDPYVEYAYAKNGKVTVVRIQRRKEEAGWMHFMEQAGLHARDGGKVVKRLSQADRSFLCHSKHSRFQVVLLDKPETWPKDLEERLYQILEEEFRDMCESEIEKAMDGLAILSRSIQRAGLVNLAGEAKRFGIPRALLTRAKTSEAVNLRALVPGHGFLKSQTLWADWLPDYTVLTHSTNFKKELEYTGEELRVYWDPQPGKDKSSTNVQYLAAQPWLFSPDQVYLWLEKELAARGKDVNRGKFQEDLAELLESMEDRDGGIDPNSFSTMSRIQAMEWLASGGNLFQLPTLMTRAYTAKIRKILDGESVSVRVPIPHSVHWQIVSSAMIRLADPTFPLTPQGKVRFHEGKKLAVVSSKEYGETSVNLGGGDQDDFCEVMVRKTQEGQKVVVGIRCPNDHQEYGVWEVEGPLPKILEGEPPVIPTPRKDWPLQRSKVSFTPEKPPKQDAARKGMRYAFGSLREQLRVSSTNPGFGILVRELQMLSYKDCPLPPLGMEDTVDICVQGGSAEEISWVMDQWKNALLKMRGDRVQIPKMFWEEKVRGLLISVFGKPGFALQKEFDRKVVNNHPYDLLLRKCNERIKQWIANVQRFIHERHVGYLLATRQEKRVVFKYKKQCHQFRDEVMGCFRGMETDAFDNPTRESLEEALQRLKVVEEKLVDEIGEGELPRFLTTFLYFMHQSPGCKEVEKGKFEVRINEGGCLTTRMWPHFLAGHLYLDPNWVEVQVKDEDLKKLGLE